MKRLLPLTAGVVGAGLLTATAVWARTDERPAGPAATSATTPAAPVSASAAPSTAAPSPDHAGTDDMAGMDHAGTDDMAGMDHAGTDDMAGMDHAGMDHAGMDAGGQGHGKLAPLAERRAAATPDEVAAAEAFWEATKAAVAPYEDLDAASAAGFVPNKTQLGNVTIHYPHPANRRDDRQLDPAHPEGLVYRNNPDGTATLLGVVYTVAAGEPAPTPGGPVFSWHTHDEACGSFYVPPGECGDTFRMLHVWTADGVVDPFTQPFGAAIGRMS